MEMFCEISLLINLITLINAERNYSIFNYNFFQNEYHIVPHHIEIVRYNKSVANKFEIKSFKYNRTCAAVNVTIQMNIDNSQELEVIIQAYRFSSNEYRLFPMRFQVNLCKAVDKDIVGLGNLKKCGNFTGCPIEKNKIYHICNWTPDEKRFPPGIRTGKYKMRVFMMYRSTEAVVFDGYGDINSVHII